MSEFIGQWFDWFTQGMKDMPEDVRARFFGHCGMCCAKTGVINLYESAFKEADCDLDVFFENLSKIEGVSGRVITTGHEYEISFLECLCDLHTNGYMNDPVLCECSKGSVKYVMERLLPDRETRVEERQTILGGADKCSFIITLL